MHAPLDAQQRARNARAFGILALALAEGWVLMLAVGATIPTTMTLGHELEQGLVVQLLVVGDCLVLMPVGWVACLSRSAAGRRLALGCAAGIVIVAVVATWILASIRDDPVTLSILYFVTLAVPAGLLLWGIRRVSRGTTASPGVSARSARGAVR